MLRFRIQEVGQKKGVVKKGGKKGGQKGGQKGVRKLLGQAWSSPE